MTDISTLNPWGADDALNTTNLSKITAAITEMQPYIPLHATDTHDFGTVNAGATATWAFAPLMFTGVAGSGNGALLGFENQALPAGIVAQAFNDDEGTVTITLTNVTAGNIVVGSLDVHVWLFRIPA